MVFSSTLFLFLFLPLTIFFYFVIPPRFLKLKNTVLLLASLVFYAWGEPIYVFLMLFSITINYLFGLFIAKVDKKLFLKRLLLVLAVIFNLGILGYFKYFNFFVDNLNSIFHLSITTNTVMLPIGVSFFTFQILSYTIDVYWGHVAPQKNWGKLALYISFFPQLIAGPIVRYIDIETQLSQRKHSMAKFSSGAQRFIIGLAKKVLIANQVAVFADIAFGQGTPPIVMAWVGAICYALQIYFDFSGYSDMAIGLGRIFGFEFLENFNYPYISQSIQEFWRRWHISLSTWFRDYLYIPLGGNRKGNARTYLNLFIVFAVTGLWHGASWSFVLWGLFHGVFLVIERLGFGRVLKKIPSIFRWIYTMLVVLIGWVLFRADNLTRAIAYLRSMFTLKSIGLTMTMANLNAFIFFALILGIVFSFPVAKKFWQPQNQLDYETTASAGKLGWKYYLQGYAQIFVCIFLLLLSITFLSGSDFNPFLYFRF